MEITKKSKESIKFSCISFSYLYKWKIKNYSNHFLRKNFKMYKFKLMF